MRKVLTLLFFITISVIAEPSIDETQAFLKKKVFELSYIVNDNSKTEYKTYNIEFSETGFTIYEITTNTKTTFVGWSEKVFKYFDLDWVVVNSSGNNNFNNVLNILSKKITTKAYFTFTKTKINKSQLTSTFYRYVKRLGGKEAKSKSDKVVALKDPLFKRHKYLKPRMNFKYVLSDTYEDQNRIFRNQKAFNFLIKKKKYPNDAF